jgi:oligogalacturonide transport system substrate-binding protein
MVRLREGALGKDQKFEIGELPMLPGAKKSGLFGRPGMLFVASKNTKHPEIAAKFFNYMLTDPEAARILGLTRGMPSADSQYNVLVAEKRIQPAEIKAYELIKKQKDSGNITLPSPLYEHPRMQTFIREVFEGVAYGKVSDQDAAKRLLEDGNTLLRRL